MKATGRITGILIAGAMAVGLVFYVFGKIDGYLLHQDRVVSDSSRAMAKIHATLVRYRDKLAAVERRHSVLAAAAHSAADSLRAALARGARVDTVPVLVEIARQDSTAFQGCSLVVRTCQQRADHAEAEAERLTRQLERQLTVRDYRCGLFVGLGPTVFHDGGRLLAANFSLGCRLFRLPLLP
jgi:hypothetical protein